MIDAVAEVRLVTANVKVAADAVEPVNDRPENVATPDTAATLVVPDNVPLPAVTLTVLVALVTVLLFASAIRTTGCVDNTAPDAPATGCVATTSLLAAPAVPVAVNVTGEPDSDPDVAVSVGRRRVGLTATGRHRKQASIRPPQMWGLTTTPGRQQT